MAGKLQFFLVFIYSNSLAFSPYGLCSHFVLDRNLVDAANIAALAALLTFRRPECSLGGEDGQEVIIHPPEVSTLNGSGVNFRMLHG